MPKIFISFFFFFFGCTMQHVESSLTRDWTYAPSLGAQNLNHWTIREILQFLNWLFSRVAYRISQVPTRSPREANDQGQLRGEGLGSRALPGPHWPWWKFLGKGGPAECPRLLGVGVGVGVGGAGGGIEGGNIQPRHLRGHLQLTSPVSCSRRCFSTPRLWFPQLRIKTFCIIGLASQVAQW